MVEHAVPNVIDWRSKGLPAVAGPIPRDAIGAKGWRLTDEDLMLPVAVLRQSAITHNSGWMRRFAALTGVKVAPHGKTTMSGELFAMQMADGAWGMTAATAGHVRIYRAFGLRRILLANQLVGRQNIAYVADELARDPDFDFYCLVDSLESIDLLEAGLAGTRLSRPLQVLIELGYAGGRTGLRDDDKALEIARRVTDSPALTLRGVEGFEGIIQGRDGDEAAAGSLLDRIVTLADRIAGFGWFDGIPILTAGGSSLFDIVVSRLGDDGRSDRFEIVLRSGCYLVHDSHFYRNMIERLLGRSAQAAQLGDGLKPALEIWSYVQSRPEPTRLIAGLGKRDIAEDVAPPTVIGWCRPKGGHAVIPLDGHRVVRLDDQHAYLNVPADSPLRPGDMIVMGVSHPCTTFDKWRTMFVVDDQHHVIDAIETNF